MKVWIALWASLLAVNAANAKPVPGFGGKAQRLKLDFDEGVYDSTMQDKKAKVLRQRESRISASSTLCERTKGGRFCHRPFRLTDNATKTAWCEGARGSGIGQWVSFDFKRRRNLAGMWLLPFYAKDRRRMFQNARVKTLELRTDSERFIVEIPDMKPSQTFRPAAQMAYHVPAITFINKDTLGRTVTTRRLTLVVRDVYPGSKYRDLCISEVAIYAR